MACRRASARRVAAVDWLCDRAECAADADAAVVLPELVEEPPAPALDPDVAADGAAELAAEVAAPAVPVTALVAEPGAEVTVWATEAGALVRWETVPPTAGAADLTVDTAPPTACDTGAGTDGAETDGADTGGVDTEGVVTTGVFTAGTVTDGTLTAGVLAEGKVTAPLDSDSTPSTHSSRSASRLPQ